MVLGGGLEPPRLTAYAPQTYVSAISPPELVQGREMINTTYHGRKDDYLACSRAEFPLVRRKTATRIQGQDSNERELRRTPCLGHQRSLDPLTRPRQLQRLSPIFQRDLVGDDLFDLNPAVLQVIQSPLKRIDLCK